MRGKGGPGIFVYSLPKRHPPHAGLGRWCWEWPWELLAPSSGFLLLGTGSLGGGEKTAKVLASPRVCGARLGVGVGGGGDGLSAAKMGAPRQGWESLSIRPGAAVMEKETEAEARAGRPAGRGGGPGREED